MPHDPQTLILMFQATGSGRLQPPARALFIAAVDHQLDPGGDRPDLTFEPMPQAFDIDLVAVDAVSCRHRQQRLV